jgi:putative addiction module component (TIGR02574 family)
MADGWWLGHVKDRLSCGVSRIEILTKIGEPSHARERRWPAEFEIQVNSRRPVMRVVIRGSSFASRCPRHSFSLPGTIVSGITCLLGSSVMTLPESLRDLPPDQKLALVTELWDDLASSAPLTLPVEELAEMRRRRDEMLADPKIAIDSDELWRRVDGD